MCEYMRILAVSDQVESTLYDHFKKGHFEQPDLILSCGDLAPEYLSFLVTVFNVPLFYVRGNHDIRYEPDPPGGCTDIDGKIVRFQALNIMGLEGSRWYNGGPVQYTEKRMKRKIRKFRFKIWRKGGIDIVIAHAPPRNIHDAEDPCHRGFRSFRHFIDQYAPAYFLHGHIHANFTRSAQRVTVVKRTHVINCFGYYLFEIKK